MKKGKILVIEDKRQVLINIETILSEEGFEVISAINGEAGINLAKKNTPDLIICDIAMPGKDGYTVLREISNNEITKAIPFIFLTAKVEKEDIRKGMKLGADDYILKPFTIEELISSVNTRIKRIETLRSAGEISVKNSGATKYSENDKFFINVNNQPQLIYIKDIVFIQAENQYTVLNTINKSFLVRKSVSKWVDILPEAKFLRIHRSTIINLDFISKIEKYYNSSYAIKLKNIDKTFIVSKRYSSKLRQNII